MSLNDRVYRLLRLPIPGLSLRTIVIFSAFSVIVAVVAIGTWVWVGVTNEQYSKLDQQLDSISSVGDLGALVNQSPASDRLPESNLVRTTRLGSATYSIPNDIELPEFVPGYQNATVDGVEYRVHTFAAGPALVALGAPLADAERQIAQQHLRVLLICGAVVIGTLPVGWVMWLIMIYPFRQLADQARAINAQSKPDEVQVRGVWEAMEIAEAVEGMLARTRAALESARDFAAAASHELRTPLTAMRTDLEVLTTLQLADEQRKEVLADAVRTQGRIEATLTALERLAQGDLSTVEDQVPLDVTELLDRAAHDAMHTYPDVHVSLLPSATVVITGLPAGLRLVIDNAIANAVKHGNASEIRLSAISSTVGIEIAVDDNGTGVPVQERQAVFERFARGSTASRSGSGLGLALVAQQAELHGGVAELETSPLGGARLLLRLPAAT